MNLAYHEARLNKTRTEWFGFKDFWDLSKLITVPDFVTDTPHKCRLAYGEDINNIQWEPYSFRTITKIQRVYDDTIDYSYKYNDRTALDNLYQQRGDAEEILIIKNGMVTDTLYCNVAFLRDGKWFTPDTPLLPGTQRSFLLDSGIIEKAGILEKDIFEYSHIRLFNAMVSWKNAPLLSVNVIR